MIRFSFSFIRERRCLLPERIVMRGEGHYTDCEATPIISLRRGRCDILHATRHCRFSPPIDLRVNIWRYAEDDIRFRRCHADTLFIFTIAERVFFEPPSFSSLPHDAAGERDFLFITRVIFFFFSLRRASRIAGYADIFIDIYTYYAVYAIFSTSSFSYLYYCTSLFIYYRYFEYFSSGYWWYEKNRWYSSYFHYQYYHSIILRI